MIKQTKLYAFLRPTLLALAISLIVMLACWALQSFGGDQTAELRQTATFASLKLPDPKLSPAEVIRTQIEALRDKKSPGLGALQCYCFAAPANRLVTGPLQRFAQMVRGAPFDEIGSCASYSIGKEQYQDDYARSLVVMVGEDRGLQVFSWVLQKQSEAPFEKCWMTTGVFPVRNAQTPQPEQERGEWL